MKTTFDPAELAVTLRAEGHDAEVDASGIQGSPYDHVYIYLTDEDGPLVIVSDAYELEDHAGYLVGAYRHYEDQASIGEAASLDEAVGLVHDAVKEVR